MKKIATLILLVIFFTGCVLPGGVDTGVVSGFGEGLRIDAYALDCGVNWCTSITEYPGSEITVIANLSNKEKVDIENIFIELYNLYDLQPTAGTEVKQLRDKFYAGESDEILWYLKIREDAPSGTSYAIGVRMCYSYKAHAEKDILFVDKKWEGTVPPLLDNPSEGPVKISASWIGSTPLKIAARQSKKIDVRIEKTAKGFVGSDYFSTTSYGERDRLTDLALSFDSKDGLVQITEKGHFEDCELWYAGDDLSGRWNCTIIDPSMIKLNQGEDKTISFFATVDTDEPSFEVSTRMYVDARYKFCVEGTSFLRVSVEELI